MTLMTRIIVAKSDSKFLTISMCQVTGVLLPMDLCTLNLFLSCIGRCTTALLGNVDAISSRELQSLVVSKQDYVGSLRGVLQGTERQDWSAKALLKLCGCYAPGTHRAMSRFTTMTCVASCHW